MRYLITFLKTIPLILLLGLGLTLKPNSVIAATNFDSIVAVVNDQTITASQLAAKIRSTTQEMTLSHTPIPAPAVLRQKVLKSLIDTQLQLQMAKKAGIQVDDATVDQAINRIAEQNGILPAQLEVAVEKQGMSYKQYRKEIHDQILLSQVQQHTVAPHVVITEQEVTDFLATHGKNLAAMTGPQAPATGDYHVQTIIIPLTDSASPDQIAAAQKVAQQVLAQLRSGDTVEKIIASPLGTQAGIQQNDLGWRKLEQLPDLYINLVRGLTTGGLSGPLRAPNGFHIVKLLETHGTAPAQPAMVETHVQHILIKLNPLETDAQIKERLQRLRAEILAGASFAEVAKTNSQDSGSAGNGGDLNWVTPGLLDPAFETVMNQMKPGQVSQPFKTHFGWHILQVLGRKSMANSPELKRQQAKQILYQRKYAEALDQWLKGLKDAQYVKIINS